MAVPALTLDEQSLIDSWNATVDEIQKADENTTFTAKTTVADAVTLADLINTITLLWLNQVRDKNALQVQKTAVEQDCDEYLQQVQNKGDEIDRLTEQRNTAQNRVLVLESAADDAKAYDNYNSEWQARVNQLRAEEQNVRRQLEAYWSEMEDVTSLITVQREADRYRLKMRRQQEHIEQLEKENQKLKASVANQQFTIDHGNTITQSVKLNNNYERTRQKHDSQAYVVLASKRVVELGNVQSPAQVMLVEQLTRAQLARLNLKIDTLTNTLRSLVNMRELTLSINRCIVSLSNCYGGTLVPCMLSDPTSVLHWSFETRIDADKFRSKLQEAIRQVMGEAMVYGARQHIVTV